MANITFKLTNQTPTSPIPTTEMTKVPDSGVHTNESGGVVPNNIVIGIGAVFMVSAVVCWGIYFVKKNKIFKSISKVLSLVFIASLTLAGLMQPQPEASADNSTGNTSENAMTVSVDDFYLEIDPTEDGTFAYGASKIKVVEPSGNGYVLGVYADTPDLINKDDSSQKITRVKGSNTMLDMNTWGIAYIEPTDETSEVWSALSTSEDNTSIIKDTDSSTDANDESIVYFGVKANDELAGGEYIGTITYVAVAKSIEPINPNP